MISRRSLLQYGAGGLASAIVGTTSLNPLRAPTDGEPTETDDPTPTATPTPEPTETPEPTPELWHTRLASDISMAPLGTDGGVLYGQYETLTKRRADSGEVAWRYDTDDTLQGGVAIADGTVYGTSEAGDVFGVDLNSGEERWETEVNVSYPRDVATHGGFVFVGGYSLHQLHAADGTVERQWDLGSDGLRGPIAIDESNIYLTRHNSPLIAVSLDSGEVAWEYDQGERYTAPEMRSAITTGERVFAGDESGTLYALAPGDGTAQWSVDLGGRISVNAVYREQLLVQSTNSRREETTLVALDPTSGEEQWRFEHDEHYLGLPSLLDGAIYVADSGGTIYRLDPGTGDQLQSYQPTNAGILLTHGPEQLYYLDDGTLHAITKSLQPP